ncbi:tetratricopeptide repeat domain protein [Nitrospira sp.]|nr:tetratricopeptide repeat domain protein [Nitrospira sp.]
MLRLLLTIFLATVGILFYGYFRELNPGTITIRTSPTDTYDLSPVTLILVSMAVGALIVTVMVGIRETTHLIGTWKSTRQQRRQEKVTSLHQEGTHAFLSKRLGDAKVIFQKALTIDPNRVDTLIWLGNLYRAEHNFVEAIRLHQTANRVEPRDIEVLLELATDLENAKRYEDALQALQDILRIDSDHLTAQIRRRDLLIRLEKWADALDIQYRLVKANLPGPDGQAQADLLVGCLYEVGRQLLERGSPDKARRFFRGAIKRDRGFLPAYIGLGEILLHEGKTKNAVDILERVFAKTKNVILLHRLEELHLELGEPSEIIRIYQEAIQRDPQNSVLRFYLGKLYYRLEMVDEAYDLLSGLEGPHDQLADYHKIMANLQLRKHNMEEAVLELKKALGFRKRVVVPYRCQHCRAEATEWSGRCRECRRWNTYVALPIPGAAAQSADRQALNPAPRPSYQGVASPFETV